MELQTFDTIMCIWNIIFFAILAFCSINAIVSVKRRNRKFILSYVLEGITVLVNLTFMYIINEGCIDYGEDKFSGLNAMGDWFGFAILIILTCVPGMITLICNIIYVVKKRKCKENFM